MGKQLDIYPSAEILKKCTPKMMIFHTLLFSIFKNIKNPIFPQKKFGERFKLSCSLNTYIYTVRMPKKKFHTNVYSIHEMRTLLVPFSTYRINYIKQRHHTINFMIMQTSFRKVAVFPYSFDQMWFLYTPYSMRTPPFCSLLPRHTHNASVYLSLDIYF